MKIFVTGATGFIGSYFLNMLSQDSEVELVALRRSLHSQTRISLTKQPHWITKQLDQVDKEDLKGVDVIVHLAAHSMNPPYDTLTNCLYWNLSAPLKLFNEALKANVNKFIVAGSCFEYGMSGEEYEFIPVEAMLKPTLTYAASKAASSIAFYQFALQNQVKLSYNRIFQVFGEGETQSRLWPSLKIAAMSGKNFPMTKGNQIRDFIPVEDVAKYFVKECLYKDLKDGQPIFSNVGSGNPQSILEFSRYWWDKWHAQGKLLIGVIPYREGEVMRYVPKI
ncbi:NAD-dependent epimerase/dehydratase family protein [Algoriphagus sp.]|uniref:NAD-dependent epimerase/dehydratase family protein n=1 Tax=Algoriphagus sp. TaxID=1872435 RepID=UPI00391BD90C